MLDKQEFDSNQAFDEAAYYNSILTMVVLVIVVIVEFYALVYMPGDYAIGLVVFIFMMILQGLRQFLPKITVLYGGNIKMVHQINALMLIVNLLSVLLLVMALLTLVDNLKQDWVKSHPDYLMADNSYQSARQSYHDLISSVGSREGLQAEVSNAVAVNKRLSDIRRNAERDLATLNDSWQQTFNAYMSSQKASGVSYDGLTTVNFANGQFICTPKISTFAETRGQPFTTLSNRICTDLNNNYPKPKQLSDVVDENLLNSLLAEANQYSDAQHKLNELDRARLKMEALFEDRNTVMVRLSDAAIYDTGMMVFFNKVSTLLGLDVASVIQYFIIGLAIFFYGLLTFLAKISGLLKQKTEYTPEQKSKLDILNKFIINTDSFLTLILKENKDANIVGITSIAVVIGFLVGYMFYGWDLGLGLAVLLGAVIYFTLTIYPVEDAVGNATAGNAPVAGSNATASNAPVAGSNATVGNAPVARGNDTASNAPVARGNDTASNAPVARGNDTVGNAPVARGNDTVGNAPAGNVTVARGNDTVHGIGFLANFSGYNEVPPSPTKEYFDVWKDLTANGYSSIGALRQIELIYNLPPNGLNNGYAAKWPLKRDKPSD